MRPYYRLIALLTVLYGTPGAAQVPKGTPVRVPVTRDLWLSNVDREADGNNGGATRLKLKSHQEMSLIDIDPRPLKGYVIHGATLYLKTASPDPMRRVTVSSFAAEWVEGTGTSYAVQKGSSTHNHRRHPDVPWTVAGSDLCAVCLGQGGTVWAMADASPPDEKGWQRVAIDPAVVKARVAGVSHGFLLFDDTGSEWTRDGEKWKLHLFPNRFFHSRESGAENAPYLIVYLGPKDGEAPAPPAKPQAAKGDLPAGEAFISWETPSDKDGAGTAGFVVTVEDQEIPRYLIPAAGKLGERVTMHLRDLGRKASEKVRVRIHAVDGAGNTSEPVEITVALSDRVAAPLPGKPPIVGGKAGPLPKLGDIEVSVLDELDKVNGRSGELMPAQKDGYQSANHLWNAKERRVALHAARNEFVAFQVHFRGRVQDVTARLHFDDDRLLVNLGRYVPVNCTNGPMPDPIAVLQGPFSTAGEYGSLHFEVYVRHTAPAGEHKGTLTLTMGEHRLELSVVLRVWDFTLPDYLSFLPEMNAYDLDAGNERLFYRFAHRHRTVLNVVPYYQSGVVADGKAGRWNGRRFDWTAWDQRFGPYLDGSAFNDLPRKGVPLECFYLPLHENWPTPVEGNYNHSYWADEAFKPSYRADFVEATRLIAIHFHDRRWDDTLFHFYLNGKNHYKERGWSRASSPWLLDEPANFQDFWALRWYGAAFHDGVARARADPRMLFRADISRPMWQRDSLDGLLDYNVVSGSFRQYQHIVLDRKRANGELLIEYGSTSPVEDSAVQPAAWCVDAWCLGADGVLPWQTIGTAEAWKNAEDTALLYPPRADGGAPQASLRLKAYRRGQQDVEYLTLLAQVTNQPRWAVGQRVREALKLSAIRQGEGEDAGLLNYRVLPQDLWALRVQVGEYLSSRKPEAKRRLVDFRTPPRDPAKLEPRHVSVGDAPGTKPRATLPTVEEKVIQGSDRVRDVLVTFEFPDKALGSEGRENPVRRADECNAFLVRFDLAGLKLDPAKLERATARFFVWDPHDEANTRVHAFPLKMEWDEATATWRQPMRSKKWQGGANFVVDKDAGKPGPGIVVKLDECGEDIADPPVAYDLDVTDMVRDWLAGKQANYGLAIAPVMDRAVDDGIQTRFQVHGREYEEGKYSPRLTVRIRR